MQSHAFRQALQQAIENIRKINPYQQKLTTPTGLANYFKGRQGLFKPGASDVVMTEEAESLLSQQMQQFLAPLEKRFSKELSQRTDLPGIRHQIRSEILANDILKNAQLLATLFGAEHPIVRWNNIKGEARVSFRQNFAQAFIENDDLNQAISSLKRQHTAGELLPELEAMGLGLWQCLEYCRDSESIADKLRYAAHFVRLVKAKIPEADIYERIPLIGQSLIKRLKDAPLNETAAVIERIEGILRHILEDDGPLNLVEQIEEVEALYQDENFKKVADTLGIYHFFTRLVSAKNHYAVLEEAINHNNYKEAAVAANILLSDPNVKAMLPARTIKYAEAARDTAVWGANLFHLADEGSLSADRFEAEMQTMLQSESLEVVYESLGGQHHERFKRDISALASILFRMKNAQTSAVFLRETQRFLALLEANPILENKPHWAELAAHTKILVAGLRVAGEEINTGNYTQALAALSQITDPQENQAASAFIPPFLHHTINDVQELNICVNSIQSEIQAGNARSALAIAKVWLAKESSKPEENRLLPEHFRMYERILVEALSAVDTCFSVEGGYVVEAAIREMLEKDVFHTFYAERYANPEDIEGFERFKTQIVQAVHLINALREEEDFSAFCEKTRNLMGILSANPILGNYATFQRISRDTVEAVNALDEVIDAYNEGRYADAVNALSLLKDRKENILFQRLPMWVDKLIQDIEGIKGYILLIQARFEEKNYYEVINLFERLLDSSEYKALTPTQTHAYTDEIASLKRLAEHVRRLVDRNLWDQAQEAILTHVSQEAFKKLVIRIVGQENGLAFYEELSRDLETTTSMVKDLLQVCTDTKQGQRSMITGLAYWANEYLIEPAAEGEGTPLDFLKETAFYRNHRGSPLIELAQNLAKILARRGPMGEAPSLQTFSIAEQVRIGVALERFYYRSGENGYTKSEDKGRALYNRTRFVCSIVGISVSFAASWLWRMLKRLAGWVWKVLSYPFRRHHKGKDSGRDAGSSPALTPPSTPQPGDALDDISTGFLPQHQRSRLPSISSESSIQAEPSASPKPSRRSSESG